MEGTGTPSLGPAWCVGRSAGTWGQRAWRGLRCRKGLRFAPPAPPLAPDSAAAGRGNRRFLDRSPSRPGRLPRGPDFSCEGGGKWSSRFPPLGSWQELGALASGHTAPPLPGPAVSPLCTLLRGSSARWRPFSLLPGPAPLLLPHWSPRSPPASGFCCAALPSISFLFCQVTMCKHPLPGSPPGFDPRPRFPWWC